MEPSKLPTEFAPAERARAEVLEKQYRALAANALVGMLFDTVDSMVVILDEHRQIVFMNRAFLKAIGRDDVATVVGLRPGEALDCEHSCQSPAGCGTTIFCVHCGAANAILSAQGGEEATHECRIPQRSGQALDLLVRATPVTLGNCNYTVFSATDIGDTKRRQALEQTFFHDITNTAFAVKGAADMLRSVQPEHLEKLRAMVFGNASRLVDEIASHRLLLEAEQRELTCNASRVHSLGMLEDLATVFAGHRVSKDREITLDPKCESVTFSTDPVLLSRVLGNMLKNALEASRIGEAVTLGCKREGEEVVFTAHNTLVMPQPVQLQVFQRSFSTKGAGRGLGTYSMRLLAEGYLKGKVGFTSSPETGTIFWVRLPLNW